MVGVASALLAGGGGAGPQLAAALLLATAVRGRCGEGTAAVRRWAASLEAGLGEAAARQGNVRGPDHWSALGQLLAGARLRRRLRLAEAAEAAEEAPARSAKRCPAAGAGVGDWQTEIEEFHFSRHSVWATQLNYCESMGLWTSGCGVICPLRAATIGTWTNLQSGQLVLDVGSGCGHYAFWLHDWFGARTVGVDFVGSAVDFSTQEVSPVVPAEFCWFNVATEGLGFLPQGSVDLAIAVSVLHYLRTDNNRFEQRDSEIQWNPGPPKNKTEERTPCSGLPSTRRTQCYVAREMFRTVRVGGHVWICHNGSYKGKWDPKRVWGPQYWRCCFGPELQGGLASLAELPEQELFLHGSDWDPTYSVVLRRLRDAAEPASLVAAQGDQ